MVSSTTGALDDEPKLNTSHNEPNNNLDVLFTGFSWLSLSSLET